MKPFSITAQGVTLQIAELISSSNYGTEEKPNWYIEFRQPNGRYGYYKQASDGGTVAFN